MTTAAPVRHGRTGLPVRCRGLVHIYPTVDGDDVVALRGLDLDVAAGENLALLGPSGCGKSTLLSLMCGLMRPSAGRLLVGDADVGRLDQRELMGFRSGRVGVVLQGAARNLLPYGTAVDNIEFAQATVGRSARARVPAPRELLAGLGLSDVAGRPAAGLSGGEQQRVAIAVAVANAPGLLLADEPTSQLDAPSRDEVLQTVAAVRQRLGTTVVTVTHDPAVARQADRVVIMRDGRVGAEGRSGEEYAVVGDGGTLHVPEDLLTEWRPGTRVRFVVDETDAHLHITRVDPT
jgi:ABC-type lipoprotein export system ATPase subunit